jgi:hypothetical protein
LGLSPCRCTNWTGSRLFSPSSTALRKPWLAAERLSLTTRQVRRLAARLREHGPAGLVSGPCAKPSNNRLDAVTTDRALSIIRERYIDFSATSIATCASS